MYFAWSLRLLTAPVKPKKSTVAFCRMFDGHRVGGRQRNKRNTLWRFDFTAEAMVVERSRYHSSTGFPCKKAQTFPGLMALCPERKPVYHDVLLRQYGEGLWEIT